RDPAAGPRLLRGPLDDVVAVAAFGAERVPGALALVPSPHVHVHHGVTHAREHDEPVVHAHVLALHAVRRPYDDDGIPGLALGPVDVGVQRHAVAHGNGAVMVDQNAFEVLR